MGIIDVNMKSLSLSLFSSPKMVYRLDQVNYNSTDY